MDPYEPDLSAPRVDRYREHMNGDHSHCLYESCDVRRDFESRNEAHLFAIAVFAELDNMGIDAGTFFGRDYTAVRFLADCEFPDFDYLPASPDFVHRMKASIEVRNALTECSYED